MLRIGVAKKNKILKENVFKKSKPNQKQKRCKYRQ